MGEMQGSVRLFDRDTCECTTQELASLVGLVLQNPDDQICTTTVDSEIVFGMENLCLPPAEIEQNSTRWLERFGLSTLRRQATQTLSGGQKQRLLLASIMAMGPRILLFDEPFAQLDGAGAAELLAQMEQLRREGVTIVVAEHRLEALLDLADRVIVLDQGHIASDKSAVAVSPLSAEFAAKVAVEKKIDSRPRRAPRPGDHRVLNVAGLTYHFSPQHAALWSDLNFEIDPGECVGVIGPNGSGKSTLLHAIAGLVTPCAGTVELAAPRPGTTPLALVPQNPDLTLFCQSVYDELCFGPRQMGLVPAEIEARVSAIADRLGLTTLLADPPLALSQGQRLRVSVGAAMSLHPRLLLLDEPTTGQDPEEFSRLLAALADAVAVEEVGAILFSTHDATLLARFASRVLILAGGRLLANGRADELLIDETLMCEAHVTRHTKNRRDSASAACAPGQEILPSSDL